MDDAGLLIKGVTGKIIKNETKIQIDGFLGMLLGTLGVSLLGKMLVGKGVIKFEQDKYSRSRFVISPLPLLILKYKSIIKTNFNLIVFI